MYGGSLLDSLKGKDNGWDDAGRVSEIPGKVTIKAFFEMVMWRIKTDGSTRNVKCKCRNCGRDSILISDIPRCHALSFNTSFG